MPREDERGVPGPVSAEAPRAKRQMGFRESGGFFGGVLLVPVRFWKKKEGYLGRPPTAAALVGSLAGPTGGAPSALDPILWPPTNRGYDNDQPTTATADPRDSARDEYQTARPDNEARGDGQDNSPRSFPTPRVRRSRPWRSRTPADPQDRRAIADGARVSL